MTFSDHGICFVGIFSSVYSIYFMIVDYVGILFFFSPRRFLSVNFSIIKSGSFYWTECFVISWVTFYLQDIINSGRSPRRTETPLFSLWAS